MIKHLTSLLYQSQTKSADLLIAIISGLLGLVTFGTRNAENPGESIQALEQVARIELWGALLVVYGVSLLVATISDSVAGKVLATGMGTFVWVALVASLMLNAPITHLIFGLVIYGSFAAFSMWSYINAQEEHRLRKKFGQSFRKINTEETLTELLTLRDSLQETKKHIQETTAITPHP